MKEKLILIKSVFYFLGIVITISHFFSCEVFTTREAEIPDQPRSNYQQAITPELLIQNMVNSFKDKNTQNYLACFSDSSFANKDFVFIPSAGSTLTFPFLIDNWTKKNEEQYFNNMKAKISEGLPVTLVFSNTQFNPLGDSLIFTAQYFITAPISESLITNNYQGEVKFKMIRDSRLVWTIYFWQDIKLTSLPSLPTWSELKGFYY